MANNCLVTELNAAINNSELDKLGYYRVKVSVDSSVPSNRRRVRITHYDVSSTDHFIVNVIGGAAKISTNSDFSNPVSSIDLTSQVSSGTVIYLLEGEYELELSSKYKVKDFGLENNNPSIIAIDLSAFAYANPRYVNINNQNDVIGDLSAFDNSTLFESLVITAASPAYSKVTGDITMLRKNLGLITLTLTRCSEITGDIEDLAKAMYSNGAGRTSGTLNINAPRSGLTYGSIKFADLPTANYNIVFTAGGYTISAA